MSLAFHRFTAKSDVGGVIVRVGDRKFTILIGELLNSFLDFLRAVFD
jgi:hypothetical protein